MRRLFLALAATIALTACADPGDIPEVTDARETQGSYSHPGPKTLSLVSVINNRTGAGGHTALVINGSERVIFDPAGSFRHEAITRDGDVLVGMTPAFLSAYRSMHARPAYHVVTQTVEVTPEVAERALKLAYDRGSVAQAHCARATSDILRSLPGFEQIDSTYYPKRLQESFAQVTGVEGERYYEDFTPTE